MWYVHTFYTDCGLVSPFLVISANYYMSTSSYCKFLSSRGSWYYLVVGLVAKRMWNILVFEVSESWRWDLGTKKRALKKRPSSYYSSWWPSIRPLSWMCARRMSIFEAVEERSQFSPQVSLEPIWPFSPKATNDAFLVGWLLCGEKPSKALRITLKRSQFLPYCKSSNTTLPDLEKVVPKCVQFHIKVKFCTIC